MEQLVRDALLALYGFSGAVFVCGKGGTRFALNVDHSHHRELGVLSSIARTATCAAKLRRMTAHGQTRTLDAFKSEIKEHLAVFERLVACIECVAMGTTEKNRPIVTLLWLERTIAPAGRALRALWMCCRAVGAGTLIVPDGCASAVAAMVLSETYSRLEASLAAAPTPRLHSACVVVGERSTTADPSHLLRTLLLQTDSPHVQWRTLFNACCKPYFEIMGQCMATPATARSDALPSTADPNGECFLCELCLPVADSLSGFACARNLGLSMLPWRRRRGGLYSSQSTSPPPGHARGGSASARIVQLGALRKSVGGSRPGGSTPTTNVAALCAPVFVAPLVPSIVTLRESVLVSQATRPGRRATAARPGAPHAIRRPRRRPASPRSPRPRASAPHLSRGGVHPFFRRNDALETETEQALYERMGIDGSSGESEPSIYPAIVAIRDCLWQPLLRRYCRASVEAANIFVGPQGTPTKSMLWGHLTMCLPTCIIYPTNPLV